ncbi:MAG: DUF4129 domain-containing protein [Gemmatimonadaceae bacterium]|nr:DUF4129 domain-containing protein [Gemmatimonadaceae bacterium]
MLILPSVQQIPDSTIRSTVDAVFRDPAFRRISLWGKFVDWLGNVLLQLWVLIRPVFGTLRESPTLYWTVIALVALILAAVIARAVYVWYARTQAGAPGLAWERSPLRRLGRDPWQAAQELAAQGNFTDAAHALYAALLEAAARQQQVRLHPSKTVGDYVRELRGRSSALFARFREFARSYETVIYGIGHCDASRYERLYALALPIVQPDGRG